MVACAAGAARETREEAGAQVEVVAPHSHLDLTHIGQHYAMFRARLTAPDVAPGVESLECAWVRRQDIPWSDLAFPAVHFALQLLYQDRDDGVAKLHHGQVRWSGSGSRFAASNYELSDHIRTPLGR